MPIKPIPAECLPALLAAVQNEAGGEIREASALRSRTTRYYLDRRGQVYSGSWVGGAPRVNRRRLSGASGLVVSTAGGPSHHSVRTLYADVWGTDHPDVAARKRTDLLRARDARRAARDARTARVKAERIGWVIAEIVTGLYTPADLARESGVHPSTLTRLVSGEIKELRPETVASLLHGRSVLVVRAGADPSARLRPPPSSDDGSPLWRAAEQARRILERAERPLTKVTPAPL
ncbi:MAG: helix-turn-helix transcriptional regulator [Myxococcota bacterium]